jgi:predicted TIM-barrel fold metal-dependent hydrolase
MGYPASDPIYAPFYETALEANLPVLAMVGYTGAGAGQRGGGGIQLDLSHPRYIEELAIQYPDLKIISSRPAWPWQDEMIAIMLHKPNVWAEMHGWSPKYYTDALKREIRNRLKNRVMFGADYPLLQYERLVTDWQALGYDEAVLERVFYKNAETLFGTRPPYESSGRQYLRRYSKPAALLAVDRLRAPIRGVSAGAEILPQRAQNAAARDTRAAGA